ncbi:MAG: HD-GYP domain-containing protein [Dermatophilaceae bacterium]
MKRRQHEQRPPAKLGVLVYIGCVWAAAIALWVIAWITLGPPPDLGAMLVLLVVAVVSHLFRDREGGPVFFAFSSIVLLACVVLVGPVGCGIIGAVMTQADLNRLPLRHRLFNSAMTAVWSMLGAFVYAAFGTYDLDQLHSAAELLLMVGLPLMLADVAQCVANALLLGGVVALDTGASFRRIVIDLLTTSGVAYMGYGLIGFLFVILWGPAGLGAFSAILIIPPLYVAKWAFAQYGDEEHAHQRTLEALVAAVEIRDPYAVGHSERIARLSDWMAEALAVGAAQAKALRFAAILHDIGRIAAPTTSGPGRRPRGRVDLLAVARHPDLGAELIDEIDFLRDSVDAIRHHHERYDGRGYPSGLAGTAIPLFARIIAVADAFDSLTSARPGRPALTVDEACAQLRQRAGTQLDPAAVAALERALARHTWTLHEPDFGELPGPLLEGAFDHDDPVASDRMAELPIEIPLLTERTR